MNIEDFRDFCLSFEEVHDAFPFAKAASEYDRNLLVFYVGDKWFCFVNAVEFDRCNVKCVPEEAVELKEQYEGIEAAYHMNKRHWIGIRFGSDVPDAVVRRLVRRSYELAAGSPRRGRSRKG